MRFGVWLIGVSVAMVVAAFVALCVFGFSYYQTWQSNGEGYWRYVGDGYAIPYLTAFGWSTLACVGVWTVGFAGLVVYEECE